MDLPSVFVCMYNIVNVVVNFKPGKLMRNMSNTGDLEEKMQSSLNSSQTYRIYLYLLVDLSHPRNWPKNRP